MTTTGTPADLPAPVAAGRTTTTPVPLYWASWGAASAPPLLLLHGGPGATHEYLLPQMLRLATRHRVIAYDQRGGGRSRADDAPAAGWREHVADLGAVARELLPGESPVLVGYSWGAMLAMLYAIEAVAGRVAPAPARLALVSPGAITAAWKAETDAAFAERGRRPAVQAMREAAAAITEPAARAQAVFAAAVAPWFHDPAQAAHLTRFRLMERAQRAVWESLGDYDLRPGLRRVRVPALVVAGREDPIPLASAQAAAEALGAPIVVLDGCGHVPYLEGAAPLFAALEAFLLPDAHRRES